MAKAAAVHMADANGKNICSYKAKAPVVSTDPSEVTCKRCLAVMKRDAEAEPAE